MPLKKLNFKPGINREGSRYANESGWYEGDKIRFRAGLPEKIGGWARLSSNFFLGVCRSLSSWVSGGGARYIGLGTNLKFYISLGGEYYDITPIRATEAAGDTTFAASNGSLVITVTNVAHGAVANDFVTYSGAVSLGGVVTAVVLNQQYQVVTLVDDDTYTIALTVPANGSDTGDGGVAIVSAYEVNTGSEAVVALNGWGAGGWGAGGWGVGTSSLESLRIWNQSSFGEDLVFGPRGGAIYYWDATGGVSNNRGVLVSSLVGATDVPLTVNYLFTSDVFRFVFAFGTNLIGETLVDNMFIRWSDQENVTDWTPLATNQAGSIRLSRGSTIISALQSRQEVLVWTDAALYSMQYLGAPAVWGVQLVGDNISIVGQNARAFANGTTFWMGKDGFYKYDGQVQPLRCDVRRWVFDNINRDQYDQCFASTVEAFNEVWFFYCSASSTVVDRYVMYNYLEDTWAYGTLQRSAWLDSGLLDYPIAASYEYNIVEHENGVDDSTLSTTVPIEAYIQSGEFDLEDGDHVMYMWRCLPDMNFAGSTAVSPSVAMTFQPRYSSGGAYNNPLSEGGISTAPVTRTSTVLVEQYTPQINIRVRGRQMSVSITSDMLGVQWQLGTPRIDMRPDGRR